MFLVISQGQTVHCFYASKTFRKSFHRLTTDQWKITQVENILLEMKKMSLVFHCSIVLVFWCPISEACCLSQLWRKKEVFVLESWTKINWSNFNTLYTVKKNLNPITSDLIARGANAINRPSFKLTKVCILRIH